MCEAGVPLVPYHIPTLACSELLVVPEPFANPALKFTSEEPQVNKAVTKLAVDIGFACSKTLGVVPIPRLSLNVAAPLTPKAPF